MAGPECNILYEIGVVVGMVGHETEGFVDMELGVSSQTPVHDLADRVVLTLQRG